MEHRTEEFKRQIVAQLTGPDAPSASALARKIGVSQASVLRWAKKYAGSFKFRESRKRRPEAWSKQERLETVLKATGLSDRQQDEFLVAHGLSINDLNAWKQEILADFSSISKSQIAIPAQVVEIPKAEVNVSDKEKLALEKTVERQALHIRALEAEISLLKQELEGTEKLLSLKLRREPEAHPN